MHPHVPVDQQVGYLVKRLQQQIRAWVDAGLVQHGVTMATYAALAILEHEPGLSNAELARRCFVTPQTMIQLVRSLEDHGVVERSPDPDHGRILQTRLTHVGRGLLDNCHHEIDVVHMRMLADLDSAEQAQLADLLRRCIHALEY